MSDKRIAIIGTVGLPAQYGGFETLVEYLTRHLGDEMAIRVFCSSKSYEEKLDRHNGAQLVYLPLKANGAQSIPYDILSILMSMRSSDTMLILGVSGCLVLPLIRKFTSARIVVNIDGLEWKRDKWGSKARRFLKFSERMAVRHSDAVITDNAEIRNYVLEEYGTDSAMIPYGADHVEHIALSDDVTQEYPFLKDKYAMSVCRIEPENNLHLLLEAYAEMPDKPLVIIGNWKNSDYGNGLLKKYSEYPNLHLLDPIYEHVKLNQIRSNCHLYMHGHSAGGTNPSLVEAMYLGLAICCYDVGYNRATTENRAYYFSSSSDITGFVQENWGSESLNQCAEAMKATAERLYVWGKIAADYREVMVG